MAFQKLQKAKAVRGVAAHGPFLTIAKAGTFGINQAAWAQLGQPAAIHLEWDPDACHLRIVASSPDDPAAYPLTSARLKFGAQTLLRQLGLNYQTGTQRFPLAASGRLAPVADVSAMPGGIAKNSPITPLRRTA